MLTHSVQQENVPTEKAHLNRRNMAKSVMDFSDTSKCAQVAMAEENKSVVNSGETTQFMRIKNISMQTDPPGNISW